MMSFIFSFFIFSFLLYIFYPLLGQCNKCKEQFQNPHKTIILMGDSILKNNKYVSDGKSIEDILRENTTNNILCLAEDNTTIADCFMQINKLPIELNNKSTTIFLSAGGNDILSHYVDQNNHTSILKPMMSNHQKLVKSIQTRLPNASLFILDIYYPNNLQYKQFHHILKEWNQALETNYGEKHIIYISKHLTNPQDFSFGIEPSSSGGSKIASLLLSS